MSDVFSAFEEEVTPIEKGKCVLNTFPSILPTTYRIAIIGEHPFEDDVSMGKPFQGMSGRYLDGLLSLSGIVRATCFLGHITQYHPPKNDLSNFDYEGEEIQSGLAQLKQDLDTFKPNLCILLGKLSLKAAKGKCSLSDWRGSFFVGNEDTIFAGLKCIASYHPSSCLKNYEWTPILRFDLARALTQSNTKAWNPPIYDHQITLTFSQIVEKLNHILLTKPSISCDIEGGIGSLSCIGIALSSREAFIVPFEYLTRDSVWSLEEETVLWSLLSQIMSDPLIVKIWQNGLYDRFVLQYGYNIICRNNKDDTMLKAWEYACELEKGLGFLCSIFTLQPFYKADRKTTDQSTFYKYCCTDACVTYEINSKLTPLLTHEQSLHYSFNIEALNFLLYAELRGIRYDQPTANSRLSEVEDTISSLQGRIDEIAQELDAIQRIDFTQGNEATLQSVQQICCHKRDQTKPKKDYEEDYPKIKEILSKDTFPSSTDQRFISNVLGLTLNVRSHKKFQDFLYITCGLPTQYKKDPTTKELRRTSNYEALLRLSKTHDHPVLKLAISMALHLTRAQMLSIKSNAGRMYASYNLVGTETGRISCSKSMIGGFGKDRVGANLQTVPDDWHMDEEDNELLQHGMRDLFLADEGCYLAKCDLKGSDGWTIGAYLAMLGDPTMLDDLRDNVKPAQVVAYIMRHGVDHYLKYAKDREALKSELKEVKKEDWDYFCSKGLIWGFAYLLGIQKASEMIFIQSEGKINLNKKEAQSVKDACFVRYDFNKWHKWMTHHLTTQRYPATLPASNGFTRKFFGRNSLKRCEILGEALAHLPQVYTTYATVKAAARLWNDPDNRTRSSSLEQSNNKTETSTYTRLRVEPLHQVHDELVVQFKIEDTQWAIGKIKSYFNNEILIAGQKIIIPFSGNYGTAWSMCDKHLIGEI